MGFWFAYADNTGAIDNGTVTELMPKPTAVEYPQEPRAAQRETAGSVVVQYANNDNRLRHWIWRGYPGWFASYQGLWAQLETLPGLRRLEAGNATPYVYLKEDETGELRTIAITASTTVVTPSYPFLKCRVLWVTRKLQEQGSSLVKYEETRLTFLIEDTNYNDLG